MIGPYRTIHIGGNRMRKLVLGFTLLAFICVSGHAQGNAIRPGNFDCLGSWRMMAYVGNDPDRNKGLRYCLLPPLLARRHGSPALLSCLLQPLLPNVEGILRNTSLCTKPGDVQPARPLALDKIAPESLPFIADLPRHGPLQDRARSMKGAAYQPRQ